MNRGNSAENKEAAKIGDLETGRVAKPQFGLETYPNARVGEGADETLPAGGESAGLPQYKLDQL